MPEITLLVATASKSPEVANVLITEFFFFNSSLLSAPLANVFGGLLFKQQT